MSTKTTDRPLWVYLGHPLTGVGTMTSLLTNAGRIVGRDAVLVTHTKCQGAAIIWRRWGLDAVVTNSTIVILREELLAVRPALYVANLTWWDSVWARHMAEVMIEHGVRTVVTGLTDKPDPVGAERFEPDI